LGAASNLTGNAARTLTVIPDTVDHVGVLGGLGRGIS
jgi:hypothetical protein